MIKSTFRNIGLSIWLTTAGTQVPMGYAQQPPSLSSSSNLIDGSKTPTLIPDSLALRLVFSGLAEPPNATDEQVARLNRKISSIAFTEADKRVMYLSLANFYAQYASLRKQYATQNGVGGKEAYIPARESLVSSTISVLESQLTPEAKARLRTYVSAAKSKIVITRSSQ